MIRPAQANLLQRLLSSAVLLPVIGLTVWMGGIWVVLLVAGCTLLGIHELYQLFTHMGHRPRMIGYLCGVLFIVAAWQATSQRDLAGPVLAATILITLLAELPRRQREDSLIAWSLTLSGAVYIGWTFAHFILLREITEPLRPAFVPVATFEPGAAWIILALAVTFTSDTSAYFVGRAWGRHRMAPYISPSKSWEGAIGGVVGATVVGGLLVPLLGLPIAPALGALLGGVGSIAGHAGDLAESLLKRQAGIKDSGHLIPGHGGLLDRVDSLLFTVPLLYYLVRWLTT